MECSCCSDTSSEVYYESRSTRLLLCEPCARPDNWGAGCWGQSELQAGEFRRVVNTNPVRVDPGLRQCRNCGNLRRLFDMDTCLCQKCYEYRYPQCAECSTRQLRGNMYTVFRDPVNREEKAVCRTCFPVKYYSCRACSRVYVKTEVSPEEETCVPCYQREQRMVIRDYGYKPRPKFMPPRKVDSSDLYLGVELEVELGPDLNCDNDPEYDEDGDLVSYPEDDRTRIARKTKEILGTMAYMKYDGSLSSGFEIVTHPATLEYHLNEFPWNNLLTSLKSWGVQGDSRRTAGLHVHFDKKFLTPEQQAKYAVFIYSFPEEVTAIARRQPGSYCTRKNIADYPPQSKRELHYSSSRYDAVNTTNEHTIEIRLFQSTLHPNIMLSSLEFVDSVAHFVKERKTTSFDIDATIKTGNKELWRRYVNYVHKKNYPHLCEFLTTLSLV